MTTLQVLANFMLMDYFLSNAIVIYTLLAFTLTLALYETKYAKLNCLTLPLLLLEIFRLAWILSHYDPFLSHFKHIMISKFNCNLSSMLGLTRSSACAIGNLYVYSRLLKNYIIGNQYRIQYY